MWYDVEKKRSDCMRRCFKMILCIMLVTVLSGCQNEEVIQPPKQEANEVLTMYLEGMKEQDGVVMSSYTSSGNGDNFAISDADAETIGLSKDSLKEMMSAIFNFSYTIEEKEAEATSTSKQFNVHIQTYDVMKVLSDTIDANKKEFGEIQKKKISDIEKNQEIATILVQAFSSAPQAYEADFTFTLSLLENEWKVEDANIQDFYALLINTMGQEE